MAFCSETVEIWSNFHGQQKMQQIKIMKKIGKKYV